MCKKKFLMSLICLVVALSFSATASRGANILFVSSSSGGVPADDLIKAFMEGLGHTVTYIDDDDNEATTEAAAIAADLVYISETVQSGAIGNEITEVAVPIIVVEGSAWDNMGLTEGGGGDEVTESADVDIVAPGHYMAAGLSGTVAVLTDIPGGCEFGKGIAGPEATVIATATLADNVTYDVIIVYDKGAALAAAPADGSAQVAAGIRIAFGGFKAACNPAFSDNAYALLEAAMNYALGFTAPPGQAEEPYPDDEDKDVPRDVTLSWTPGEFAPPVNGHRLYLSDNFDDVSNEIGAITLSDASYAPPRRLELGTTYYWRVDEVNAPPDSTVFQGKLWSFITEPVAYAIENVIATASSSSEGQGPENAVNDSGMTDDLHTAGTGTGTMWMSELNAPQPTWIQFDFDKVYALHEVWIWNSNTASEAIIGYGARDVSIEYSVDGNDYTPLGTTHEFNPAPGEPDYAHDTTVDFGGALAKSVRFTINTAWGTVLAMSGLSEVRFFHIPLRSRYPYPDSGATDVDVDVTLGWRAGRQTASHNVYVSTDPDALTLAGPVTEPTFDATSLDLQLGQTYHWQVDEVNDTEVPDTWQGNLWSFSTVPHITIDDFESYSNDASTYSRVFQTWIDGAGYNNPVPVAGNGTGSYMGHNPSLGDIMEKTIVNEGGSRQSAPFSYGNDGKTVSEVTRTFEPAQAWNRNGVQALVLHFHGASGNTGQMYVRINGTRIPYDGEAGNIARLAWQPWTIDLTSSGLDLQSVGSLTIGVDGSGSGGMLYFDDIRLSGQALSPTSEEIWIEAEAATTIEAPMQIFDDPTASGGKYIMKDPASNESNANPPADGLVTYTFTVAGGTYKIAGRVISNGVNDSFWVRIPGATTQTTNHSSGWVRWNGMTHEGAWGWHDIWSFDDGSATVEFTMPAGTYTLELRYREDATQLDALVITSID